MYERFEVVFLKEARYFLLCLDDSIRLKIMFNIDNLKVRNNPKLFKKLTDEIWEFRTIYGGLQYRLFAFWDKDNKSKTLVVATHGIIKKFWKIPKSDIVKAENIRKIYYEQKSK